MILLMCKECAVYDIETAEVLCFELLPGLLQVDPGMRNFHAWRQGRYSLRSNAYARVQRASQYPYNKPEEIDRLSGAFSLSDCYWVKTSGAQTFRALSPYFAENWIDDRPVANIYTNGWQSKKWISPDTLYKNASKQEIEIMRLARLVGLTDIDVGEYGDGILIKNFTNSDVMFEPADMSAAFYEDVLADTALPAPASVIEKTGRFGELMLVFDAIVGNNDRHLGNFGWLRDADSGAILGSAPLFDFDQTEERRLGNADFLISLCRHRADINELCAKISAHAASEVYKFNARLFERAATAQGA